MQKKSLLVIPLPGQLIDFQINYSDFYLELLLFSIQEKGLGVRFFPSRHVPRPTIYVPFRTASPWTTFPGKSLTFTTTRVPFQSGFSIVTL